jgi:hypothetical protein
MLKELVVCAALVGATSSVAVAGNGTNLTKYVADTTQVMLVLDVSGAKSSRLVKDSFSKLLDSQPDARAKLDEIGLDLLRDIDTVMVSFGGFDEISNMKDSASMVVIIEGRLPKDAIAKIRAKAASTETISGAEVFTRDDTEMALMDGRIFVTKKGHMADVIGFAKGKSKATLASGSGGKALRETIKRASTKMHMWGALTLPAKDKEKTVAAQLPVDAVSFGFKFSSDLEGLIKLETPSATSAEASIKTLNSALPQVKSMMGGIGLDVAANTISLAQDKAAINASIKVTQTELKGLFALIAQKKASASTPPPTKPSGPPPAPPTGGLSGKPKTP